MVARYLMGSRPMRATGLLQEASGRVLRMREALGVRDSLCHDFDVNHVISATKHIYHGSYS
jgi:hypothetical protein